MQNKIIVPNISSLDFRTNEAINMLRGSIQMAGNNVKVIAMTSARAHEGKSSLAFRLAKSLAALNKKVLFLDCDIRNSQIKKRYRIEEKTEGLSEYLCGQLPMEDIIYPTDDACFDIIFSGKTAPNPSELLSGELFDVLIRDLKARYDYVIVDTPPANVVIDGVLIAKRCDTTIIVVESGFTDRRDAMHLRDVLENSQIKVLGVILNKVDVTQNRYGYGSYGSRKYWKYGYYRADYDEYDRAAKESKKEKEKEN